MFEIGLIVVAGLAIGWTVYTPTFLADAIYLFALVILAILYFPFGFLFLKKKGERFSIWTLIFGLIFAVCTYNVLFLTMFLAGWMKMDDISIVISIIPFLLVWFYKPFKNNTTVQNSRVRSLFWLIVSFLILVTPQEIYVEIAYRDFPDLVTSFKEFNKNPKDSVAWRNFSHEFNRFHDQKFQKRKSGL